MSEYDSFRALDLNEMGTRLDHYNELREVFMIGVALLKELNPAYRSDADKVKQDRLQHAADEIKGRIDMLAKFPMGQAYGSWMQLTIDGIGRNLSLTEGNHVNQADGSDSEGEGTQLDS